MFFSRVVYASPAVTLDFQLPLPETDIPVPDDVGGSTEINGQIESFVVLTKEVIGVEIPFYESEWPSVRAWLQWSRTHPNTAFEFWFSRDDVATKYSCFLYSPRIPDPLSPGRGRLPGTGSCKVRLLSATGVPFAVNYYGL